MNSPVKSPCISICVLDEQTGFCKGCLRTGDEVARWLTMTDDQKRQVLEALIKRREKQ